MARPSRHILVLTVLATLLATLLSLAGCGSDPQTDKTGVGDVVPARAGVDTEGAAKGFVLLPSGRLDVRAGAPVQNLAVSETRERRARTSPDGGAFVPLTWSYATADMKKLVPVFGRPLTVGLTLVSGGNRYRLSPPEVGTDGQSAAAYYVAVEGSGEDATIEIQYADVTQTLDLRTGDRSAGRAAALYDVDLTTYTEKLKTCPTKDWSMGGRLTQVAFTCSSTPVLVSPFVDGEWAPKDSAFAVLGVASTLSAVNFYAESGAAASYSVSSSTEKAELNGERPIKVIDETLDAGNAAGILVFPLTGELPKNVKFHRSYTLVRTAVAGTIKAPFERQLEIFGMLTLR